MGIFFLNITCAHDVTSFFKKRRFHAKMILNKTPHDNYANQTYQVMARCLIKTHNFRGNGSQLGVELSPDALVEGYEILEE
jgi:hypothetical protein